MNELNELELKKFKAQNLQGRMKHLSDQLEFLKSNMGEWETFQTIINMKLDRLISDSISLGSNKAAKYLALMQNQLNNEFNVNTIILVKEQIDEVLNAMETHGVEIVINAQEQPAYGH